VVILGQSNDLIFTDFRHSFSINWVVQVFSSRFDYFDLDLLGAQPQLELDTAKLHLYRLCQRAALDMEV
jgi:hypothetical protein